MKKRIELSKTNVSGFVGTGPVAAVVDSKPGSVGLIDKLKGYYHTLIAVIGAVVVFLNAATPATEFLPQGVRDFITVATGFVVALANLLKRNETWVDSL